jgi:putative spermidine/putrescine transport system permease protein
MRDEILIKEKQGLEGLFTSATAWFGYLFLILPTCIVIPMSFGSKDELMFPPKSFSLYLYEQFFFHGRWIEATLMSFRVALGATFLALILGVPAAYSLVRGNYPGKRLISYFLLSPIIVPVIVLGLGLYFHFQKIGIAGSEISVILAHTLYTMPFIIIICMSGLRDVDENLEIAAMIMGAKRYQILGKVTFPLLKRSILAGGLFAFLMSFDEVVIAYFITAAGKITLPVLMFHSVRWEISPVLAAVSTILVVISLIICLSASSLQKDDDSLRS